MYFTDSGPFGETSLENKTGSVFLYIFEDKTLRAISYRNLAYPWGMALDQDERFLYFFYKVGQYVSLEKIGY